MARLLVSTSSWPGRADPALQVVHALVEHGHEVWWYTGQPLAAKVAGVGAHHVPMQAALDVDYQDLDAVFPARKQLSGLALLKHDVKHIFIDSSVGQLKDLTEILTKFPADLVLADPTAAPGAAVLHEKGGPPWAVLGTGLMSFGSRDTAPFGTGILPSSSALGHLRNRLLYALLNKVVFRDVMAYANQARATVGLPRLDRPIWDVPLSPFLYLSCTVPALEYPRSDLPPQVHYIGALLPRPPARFEPPAWWDELRSDRPVVHVTQGTLSNDPHELINPALRALADEDALVVVATGGRPIAQIGLDPLPANVRAESFISYHHLLPQVDLMITNAGYGGVQWALANGVPLIGAGQTEDKQETCNRIAWTGVGINLKTRTPRPEQVRQAVRLLLANPRYKANARRIRDEMALYHAPTLAVNLLETLLRTGRPVLREVAS